MRQLEYCLPVAFALLLAACGGGGEVVPGAMQSSVAGIAVGEPSPTALNREEFVKLARGASCSDIRNRLFVIDDKQVFWDRAGNCPDNGHAETLFGSSSAEVLCTSVDSIAGPVTKCNDPSARALFDTLIQNLDKRDLGLGTAHKLEAIDFLPKDGIVATLPLVREQLSGVTSALNVVIRDQESFEKLWSAHNQNRTPVPPLPKIDFTRQMVLGVFLGNRPSGCYGVEIGKVEVSGGKITAHYTETYSGGPMIACTALVTSPMDMVITERLEGDVSFTTQ